MPISARTCLRNPFQRAGKHMAIQISIITAVYNRCGTVGEALRSVQAQTHGNVQHVVIDGASRDGTLQLLQDLLPPAAVLVSEPDKGIYDALNKGIALCSGEVIGLMHSDDFFADDQVLDDVAAAFADPAVDAVYGDLDYVSVQDTSRIVRHWRAGPYLRERLAWGWMPPHPTLFVRRHVIEKWGGYDTRYRISADYDCILRYFGQGQIRVAYLPRVLVKMRVGGESNASLKKVIRKSWEDWQAMRRNRIGILGGLGSLVWKNLSKVRQFAPLPRPLPRG
jgi:glycosyltransferase involved in cell wall biosynthesis